MPKVVDPCAKREEIVNAAMGVFTRHGFRDTNLQRVAAAAGMGKSSLYHYFPTRESLAAGGDPPDRRLSSLLDAVIDLFDAWIQSGPLLLECLRDEHGREVFRDTVRRIRAALTRLIRDGQAQGSFRAGDANALSALIVGCLDGVLLQEIIDPTTRGRAAVRRELKRALEGAVVQPQRQRATE
jgi:AcrR family transcriptional regulator